MNSPILPSISRVSLATSLLQIAVDLNDLQFGLRDLAGDLGGLRDQLRGLTLSRTAARSSSVSFVSGTSFCFHRS
jgi:hypothetical protein